MRILTNRIALAALATVLACSTQAQTPAPGTLDKVRDSGKIVIGVRESSAPMAYMLGSMEKFVGYHVELCEKVIAQIAPKAKIEYMPMTAQNTLPLVQNGKVDLG